MRLPSVRAAMLVILLLAAGWLVLPSVALAQGGPTLTLPSYAVCGTDLVLRGSGFPADQRLFVFATRTQPPSDGDVEIARVSSDVAGAVQVTVPGRSLAAECREGASFALTAVRADGGKPVGDPLASARITFGPPSPSPATSGFGVPPGAESRTNPLLYVLAVIIGVTLLRSRSWGGDSDLVDGED